MQLKLHGMTWNCILVSWQEDSSPFSILFPTELIMQFLGFALQDVCADVKQGVFFGFVFYHMSVEL